MFLFFDILAWVLIGLFLLSEVLQVYLRRRHEILMEPRGWIFPGMILGAVWLVAQLLT